MFGAYRHLTVCRHGPSEAGLRVMSSFPVAGSSCRRPADDGLWRGRDWSYVFFARVCVRAHLALDL